MPAQHKRFDTEGAHQDEPAANTQSLQACLGAGPIPFLFAKFWLWWWRKWEWRRQPPPHRASHQVVSSSSASPSQPSSNNPNNNGDGGNNNNNNSGAYTDVYAHPAAMAFAAAHPRRTIPKFGPYLLLQRSARASLAGSSSAAQQPHGDGSHLPRAVGVLMRAAAGTLGHRGWRKAGDCQDHGGFDLQEVQRPPLDFFAQMPHKLIAHAVFGRSRPAQRLSTLACAGDVCV
ncbi:hypothetical protein B0H16DRAFT_1693519 [Mycena metata]|uniref:Uncharacterized protein n=1 Tax=Mycena metata TaxID=1033252 RepID=A0AAD7IKF9_9AGAR|nr:hypothetical protein B0H16DRAFT_1693519 [Mycena metata]